MSVEFEKRYQADPDPWNFATSPYERARYQAILESLPRAAYGTAFEPGCSVGELTAQLADVCARVIAIDIAPSAVQSARRRCARLGNVEIHCGDVATDVPAGPLDLVVFSELGYYFTAPRLVRTAVSIGERLARGGDFVAVHWLGESADHVLHGDVVHESLMAGLPLRWTGGRRHSGFRIDTWRRA